MDIYLKTIDRLKYVMVEYNAAISVVAVFLGLFIGTLLLSKHLSPSWKFRLMKLPAKLVYPFIAVLFLFLIPGFRTISINLLIIFAMFFMMQGFAVLSFYWGDYFARSRVFSFFLILALIINPYVFLLVIFTGMFELWFDIRKLHQLEE